MLSTIRNIALGSGAIGFIIDLVNMLANLDDPKKIGPAMAMAMLTVFYAVILAELIINPMIGRIKEKMIIQEIDQSQSDFSSTLPLIMFIVVGGVVLFMLLLIPYP